MGNVTKKIMRHLQLSGCLPDTELQRYINCAQHCYDLGAKNVGCHWQQYIECSVKQTASGINPIRFVFYIDISTLRYNRHILYRYLNETDRLISYIPVVSCLISILTKSQTQNKICLGIERHGDHYIHKLYLYLPKQPEPELNALLMSQGVCLPDNTNSNHHYAIGFSLNDQIKLKSYQVFTSYDAISSYLGAKLSQAHDSLFKQGQYIEIIDKPESMDSYIHINPRLDQSFLNALDNYHLQQIYDQYVDTPYRGNTYFSFWLSALPSTATMNEFTLYY